MGMKLASFSHAKTLSVNTVSGGVNSGRRWTVEGISKNWICGGIPEDEVRTKTGAHYLDLDLARCGTVIEWSRIDRLSSSKNGVQATVSQLFNRLKVHLGLHFHRFLETGRLTIRLDSTQKNEDEPDRTIVVAALNPFKYEESGSSEFPQTFPVSIPDIGKISAIAHIWPPNNKSAEYKLGNKAAARQGFYFLSPRPANSSRWLEWRCGAETEPHNRLRAWPSTCLI